MPMRLSDGLSATFRSPRNSCFATEAFEQPQAMVCTQFFSRSKALPESLSEKLSRLQSDRPYCRKRTLEIIDGCPRGQRLPLAQINELKLLSLALKKRKHSAKSRLKEQKDEPKFLLKQKLINTTKTNLACALFKMKHAAEQALRLPELTRSLAGYEWKALRLQRIVDEFDRVLPAHGFKPRAAQEVTFEVDMTPTKLEDLICDAQRLYQEAWREMGGRQPCSANREEEDVLMSDDDDHEVGGDDNIEEVGEEAVEEETEEEAEDEVRDEAEDEYTIELEEEDIDMPDQDVEDHEHATTDADDVNDNAPATMRFPRLAMAAARRTYRERRRGPGRLALAVARYSPYHGFRN